MLFISLASVLYFSFLCKKMVNGCALKSLCISFRNLTFRLPSDTGNSKYIKMQYKKNTLRILKLCRSKGRKKKYPAVTGTLTQKLKTSLLNYLQDENMLNDSYWLYILAGMGYME